MCDCVHPSSRLLLREFSGGRIQGPRLSRWFATVAASRDAVQPDRGIEACRSFPRRRAVVAEHGSSFVRVRHRSTKDYRSRGTFLPDAHRCLRIGNSARLRDDEGALDSAGLRSVSFSETGDAPGPSNFDILQLKRELEKEEPGEEATNSTVEQNNLIPSEDPERTDSESGKENMDDQTWRSRRRKQMLGRSSLIAKQVISIRSARSLGFISQLWVDTISWAVVVVEVRPHLLSGEIERLLLEDLYQVGDVALVQDESVIENELKMNGLDTLVGYNVVTPTRRKIGKVRGYNFNVDSGAVESLELDSLGMSLIPASLVSTYSLMVEDVIQVAADTVVVDQDAESRLQRLTKGFLDNRAAEAPGMWEDGEEFSDFRRRAGRSRRRRKASFEDGAEDYWDLPVDF